MLSELRHRSGGALDRGASALERLLPRPSPGPAAVGLAFAAWDAPAAVAAVGRLEAALRRNGVAPTRRVLADNAGALRAEQLPVGWEVVAGENAEGEFSAWDRALAADGPPVEVWLLANDRFDAYGHRTLDDLDPPALGLLAALERCGRGALVGTVDRWPALTTLDGLDVTSWVTTNLFALTAGALRSLGGLRSYRAADLATLVVPPPASPAVSPACGTWARRIDAWLLGGPSGQGTSWHGATPDLPRRTFERKVLAVANEHALTARARAAGVLVASSRAVRRAGVDDRRLCAGRPDRALPGPSDVVHAVRSR